MLGSRVKYARTVGSSLRDVTDVVMVDCCVACLLIKSTVRNDTSTAQETSTSCPDDEVTGGPKF